MGEVVQKPDLRYSINMNKTKKNAWHKHLKTGRKLKEERKALAKTAK